MYFYIHREGINPIETTTTDEKATNTQAAQKQTQPSNQVKLPQGNDGA